MKESQSKDFEFRSWIDLDANHQLKARRCLVFEIKKRRSKDEDLWIDPGFGYEGEKK